MTDINQKVQEALNGFEAFKTDLAAKMGKLDAFDAKKFEDIQASLAGAIQLAQDVKAEKAEREKLEAKMAANEEKTKLLEAALSRPALAVTPAEKAKEFNAKGTKLFNDFARKRSENQTYFEDFFDGVQAAGGETLGEAEKKALTVNSDPNGGYLTMPEFGGIVQTYVYETSPLRQLASVIAVGTDSYELITDNDQAGWGWVGETQARPDTYTPQLGKLAIPVNEMYAMPNASQKMLDDAMIDVEAWLAGKVAEVFARGEAQAFISGNGVNKPLGLLSYAAGTAVGSQQVQQVNLQNAAALTYGGLVALQNSLKEPYQRNAAFLMQRASMAGVLSIMDGQGRPIFNPVYDKNAGLEGYVMGRPIYFAADMPGIGTNALAVAYGDFKQAYQIVDRFGVRVLRDPYTNKPFVRFYTTKRVGGAVKNFEAYVLGKIAS